MYILYVSKLYNNLVCLIKFLKKNIKLIELRQYIDNDNRIYDVYKLKY